MANSEDPGRQLSYLQQSLSSDKKPLGLFLGAGCPMAVSDGAPGPLIPDISGITARVGNDLANCKTCGPLLKVIEEHFEEDGRDKATVEDMLTHIRALRAVAGKANVRGFVADDLDRLDDRVCQLIHEVVNKDLPCPGTPYHRIASWVDSVRRDNPVEVFTTNYDTLMEQAFEDLRVPYFDGFAGGRRPFFDLRAMEEDVLPPRWARFWKLHGSINWYQVAGKGVFRGTAQEEGSSKRVIHPSHLKYQESRRMPYLAMIDRLRAFLKKQAATLVLCGYSFRDEHINEVIVQGLEYSETANAFALLFDVLSSYPQAVSLGCMRNNLSILARDGAVIGGQQLKWSEQNGNSGLADGDKWVKWTAVDPGNVSGKHSAEFLLGDFAVFGNFLQELVGSTRLRVGGTNA